MLKPLGADKHQVVFANLLYAVANHSPNACAVLYEVEFQLLVLVERVAKFALVPFDNVEAVFFR